MSYPPIQTQQRASVVSFASSEAAIDAKPNQVTRNGFQVAMSNITTSISNFFKRNQPQEPLSTASSAPAAPAAPPEKCLSVETSMKPFPKQCLQECLQHLQEAKEKRSALPDAEQFGELAKAFTENYDKIFSHTFREPLPCFPVEKEIKDAERKTLLAIWEGLNQERNEGKDCLERATYMLFVCGDGAPEYSWLAELPQLRQLGAQNEDTQSQAPQLPASSAPKLLESERQALRATFKGIVPDWEPETTPAPAPAPILETALPPAPAAIEIPRADQAKPEKNIIERIYRTNVSARKMLITANPGTTEESRQSFAAFSSRLDKIYLASFKEQFEDFRSKNYSVSQAAGMAAETAFNGTALKLRLETIRTDDPVGRQYVKDMFSKENAIKKLAIELLDGPGKLLTEEVLNARVDAEHILAGEPYDWATQGKPVGDSILDPVPGKSAQQKPAISLLKKLGKVKRAIARLVTPKKAAKKNTRPVVDNLEAAGERTRMIFDRAREICAIGVRAPECFGDIFKDAFKARFDEGVQVFNDAQMTPEQEKQLPTTWRHDIAYVAAVEATRNLMKTMKASNDPHQRAYAKELWRVRGNFQATIKDLFYATRLLSVEDAGKVLSKK